uniref:Major Facilitator Superfamily (MFS) putative n=1 Tax=Albugo laibachii Nc14 TaxID=890382 RepID=F0WMI2_9STRA|nr:Major Facilitator Superfamily (MFS) putative [Albugo laibachii Nc14]|eukprot:CCA22514.1 Major Facilitator Superfamily (MFS) putative [Albugo laibachii Nc14]
MTKHEILVILSFLFVQLIIILPLVSVNFIHFSIFRQMETPSKSLWAPKLLYAIGSAGQSAMVNYIAIYFQHVVHLSEREIGILQTLPCVCAILSPPIWGAIADYFNDQRMIHNICAIGSAFLLFSISYFEKFGAGILMIVTIGNFLAAPCGSLQDHAVLHMLEKTGGEYGKQRLFGAIGWGVGAYVVSILVQFYGLHAAFYVYLVLMLLSVAILQRIPPVRGEKKSSFSVQLNGEEDSLLLKTERSNQSISIPQQSCNVVKYQKDVVVLLVVIFLMGLMFGVLSSYLTMFLYNLSGKNSQIVGIAIVCETISELPAFFFSQQLIDRFGVVAVLMASIVAYGIRITFYWLMTNAWTAIPLELLHGVTFGLSWAACTQYIFTSAPIGLQGSMMGILNAVQNGLGRGAGTLIGGILYEKYSPQFMWMITDIGVPLSFLGLLVFASIRTSSKERKMTEEEKQLQRTECAQILSPYAAHEMSIFKELQ